jgi:DNA primase
VVEAAVVFVVEGERDVETLREHGFVATCNPGGAGKWRPEYADLLRGKTCIVIPDTDEPGRKHAEDVIRSLRFKAARILRVDLSDDGVKDITEWFERGHSEVELCEILDRVWDAAAEAVR